VRSCHNCGYLVPESWDTCKRCHAALKDRVPATVAGGRIGTTPYAAAPPANSYEAGYDAPVRIGFPDPTAAGNGGTSVPQARHADAGESWSAPVAKAPPTRPSFRLIPALVVAIVVTLGFFGWQTYQDRKNAPPAGTREWVDGDGVAYAPPGRGYNVRLPDNPAEQTLTQNVAGASVAAHVAYTTGDDWEMAVATADVGAIPGGIVDAALSGAAGGFASGTGGEVKDQKRTEHQGHAAVDATVDIGDDFPARVRVVYDGARAYVLVVHAKSGARVLFDELVESFRLQAVTGA
jgi:hypothetical protein